MNLPLGYRYSAIYAGIRKVEKNDLALILSDVPAAATAVFTTNRVQAAPVRVCTAHLKESGGKASAILVNAGNANCATRTGDRVAVACARAVARLAKRPANEVLPASTGVIGVELDARLITDALPALFEGLSPERFDDVADAMTTTDTFPKKAFERVRFKGGEVRIAGMTKGAGMIQPNMATTLGFVMTDAALPAAALGRILRDGVERSYHRLSVDGDTSTNDTVALLANGASGYRMTAADKAKYAEAVAKVLESLARDIARDGEGARKLITIEVSGAVDDRGAVRIARAIANSPLVKTAVAGSDPNWGRILCAAGYSGVAFDPRAVDIFLQGTRVCRQGLAAEFSEPELKAKLDEKECVIRFRMGGGGKGAARFWTCDFTEGYIHVNASYRT